MITVEVYASNQTGIGVPLAILAYSGRGKKVKITTDNITVKEELTGFVNTVLSFPKQGRVPPEDRKLWMESLPMAQVSVPYWFKIAEEDVLISTNIEEVENDNEEANGEEDDGEGNGSADDDGGEDTDGDNPDGGETDGGYANHNA